MASRCSNFPTTRASSPSTSFASGPRAKISSPGREAVIFDAAQYPFLERSGAALQRLAHRHFPRIRIDLTVQAIGLPVFFLVSAVVPQVADGFSRVMV